MATTAWQQWYTRQCKDENNEDKDANYVHDSGDSSNEYIQRALTVLTTAAITIENLTVCRSWGKKIDKTCTSCCVKPVKHGSKTETAVTTRRCGCQCDFKNDRKVATKVTMKTIMTNVETGEDVCRHVKTWTVAGIAAMTTENTTLCDIWKCEINVMWNNTWLDMTGYE